MTECNKCGNPMKVIYKEQELMECDINEMTEGQMAEYMAAEMSGEYGEWAINIASYKCSECGKTETVKYI